MDATEVYKTTIKSLSASERLRLATMILNELPPESISDYSDEWTEEDLAEFSASTWGNSNPTDDEDQHAASR